MLFKDGAASPEADSQQQLEDETQRVASVFASSDSCRAYNGFGDLVDISIKDCLDYADNPRKLRATSDTYRQQRLQAVNYAQYTTQSTAPGSDTPSL